MEEKEKKIMDAAMRVFWRYGIQRSSMADIARETGVSRQTLYKSFSNKDELVRAIMRTKLRERNQEIEAAIANVVDLSDQLDVVFKLVVVQPYELLSKSQHAADIVEGVGKVGRQEMQSEAFSTHEIFKEILVPHAAALKDRGMNVDDLAHLAQKTCRSIKETANNKSELTRLVDCLKGLILLAAEKN